MRHYLLDTNVLLDFLTRRAPFGEDATQLMQTGAAGEARFYAASLSFANIEYIMRRQTSATYARQLLVRLAQLVEILPVDAAPFARHWPVILPILRMVSSTPWRLRIRPSLPLSPATRKVFAPALYE